MAVPKDTLWGLEPHPKAKHAILRRYLQAWFPILDFSSRRIIYVDGFCGPGKYLGGEPGSPLIAIEAATRHTKTLQGALEFWFIDERQDRIDHLRSELERLEIPQNFSVKSVCGRFDQELQEIFGEIDGSRSQPPPIFSFLDPFGFSGIPFSVVNQLLRRPRVEALITFMVDAINRFLEHPQEAVVHHIVEAFGTQRAIRIAQSPGNRIQALRLLYQEQLETVARFVRYFEMRDRNDQIQYFLFFATNHELGHTKMKEAMWAVDPQGDFRFSDATDPNQLVLFEADSTSVLIENLRMEFRGKGWRSCAEIRKFVENQTAFLKKHLNTALKNEEETGNLKVAEKKMDEKKRIAKTFPDNLKVWFE